MTMPSVDGGGAEDLQSFAPPTKGEQKTQSVFFFFLK